MKYTHYLYIASLAFLFACSSEEQVTTIPDINIEPDNGEIMLSAGIGSQKAATRAGAEDHHASHQNFTNGTKLALRISGTWTGHDPSEIVLTTTGTIGSETGADNKHNAVTCNPIRYWEDYGSSDAANIETGRAAGLTIYGAAVNGQTSVLSGLLTSSNLDGTLSKWTNLSWTLDANQSSGWSTKDLLITNNIKAGTGDGTYRFADRASGKLLEFTHALSKITVNLLAGDGFDGSFGSATPEVKLTSNEGNSTTNTEWAYTTGTVNITNGTVSSQGTPAVITMDQATTATTGYTVTKEALVMPGSQFANDNDIIVRIKVADNIYYIKAKNIREAMATAGDTDYWTKAGKNYVINVQVNQTGVKVTATVTNWTDVSAEVVEPVININTDFGTPSETSLGKDAFSFYRSTSLNTGYSTKSGSYYPAESVISKVSEEWTMTPQLYWPSHNTHYQFRGVWPQTVITDVTTSPRVKDGTGSSNGYQVIEVQNVAYSANTFPSDLQIGRPEISESAKCSNNEPGHTQTLLYNGGICASEGTITLNFRYIMSQVEVNLTTTDTPNDQVRLDGAKVELVNVYSSGDVKLGDRGVIPTGTTTTPYTLNTVDGDGNDNKRLSAIVPQILTYTTAQADGNVKFRITIYNDAGDPTNIDVYEADIKPILNSGKTAEVAPNGKWESGVHYVYNLKISKTEVKVTATLADWTTVNATQDIWF